MYIYNSGEHCVLKDYARASGLIHENKLNWPERATLLANGHIEKLPHSAGGFGYQLTESGKTVLASIQQPKPAPTPADTERDRAIELKTKLGNNTITTGERDELLNIIAKRVSI